MSRGEASPRTRDLPGVMRYLMGVDGGGTRTTLAVADIDGRELLRHEGPAGLVDPCYPAESAGRLVALVREAMARADPDGAVSALCVGLAGVGNTAEREVVELVLADSGIAERVVVRTDGEIALEGAFGGGAGILLIAGTGSIAYGRAEDGRVERCGGWGAVVGDEGSGYAIGRAGLRTALQAEDGRGEPTCLLPVLLDVLDLDAPRAIPSWAGRAEKAEVAALAPHVLRVAEGGDRVAEEIVTGTAHDLAQHVTALVRRLEPWTEASSVALVGGLFRNSVFRSLVVDELAEQAPACRVCNPAADAVGGAVRIARRMLAE